MSHSDIADPHAEFPLGPFTPYADNPILRPQGDDWESSSVYNPAAVVKDDQVVLLYRAHADDIISHVGLATSADGIHFERRPEPVLSPSEHYDEFGCRGPPGDRDRRHLLPHLLRLGPQERPALPGHVDRPGHVGEARPDVRGLQHLRAAGQRRPAARGARRVASCRPPINGRYLMYFGEGSLWYAWSDDLIHWEPCPQDEPLMVPTAPGTFGEFLVEVGPPPIRTSNGLILLVHNAAVKYDDGTVRYTCGQLLFHPDRPTEIMAQMNYPWLEPTTYEDQHGLVSNVTFVEGPGALQGHLVRLLRAERLHARGRDVPGRGDVRVTPSSGWLDSHAHARWLEAEGDRLLEFGRASRHPDGGFAWLDDAGRPELDRPVELWITCRMTHVYSLAHLMGRPYAGALADHGVAALPAGSATSSTAGGTPRSARGRPGRHRQDGVRARLRGARRRQRHRGRTTRRAGAPGRGAAGARRALLGRDRRHGRRAVGRVVHDPRRLPGREREHAHRRGAARGSRRARRHQAPRPRPTDPDPGGARLRPRQPVADP